MSTAHTVKQGECLSRIAAQYGFRDYKTIYDDPQNADFKKKRPDPNLIFPGDLIYIPDKKSKTESRPTGDRHTFKLKSAERLLRIVVEDLDGTKLANAPYELTIEGDVSTGVLPASALIEQVIPAAAENGLLKVASYQWPLKIAHLNPLDETADDGVSGIQARLSNLGYSPGPIDGIAGPLTEAAIKAFQADNPPLEVDGICGPQTRAVLIQKYGC